MHEWSLCVPQQPPALLEPGRILGSLSRISWVGRDPAWCPETALGIFKFSCCSKVTGEPFFPWIFLWFSFEQDCSWRGAISEPWNNAWCSGNFWLKHQLDSIWILRQTQDLLGDNCKTEVLRTAELMIWSFLPNSSSMKMKNTLFSEILKHFRMDLTNFGCHWGQTELQTPLSGCFCGGRAYVISPRCLWPSPSSCGLWANFTKVDRAEVGWSSFGFHETWLRGSVRAPSQLKEAWGRF